MTNRVLYKYRETHSIILVKYPDFRSVSIFFFFFKQVLFKASFLNWINITLKI